MITVYALKQAAWAMGIQHGLLLKLWSIALSCTANCIWLTYLKNISVTCKIRSTEFYKTKLGNFSGSVSPLKNSCLCPWITVRLLQAWVQFKISVLCHIKKLHCLTNIFTNYYLNYLLFHKSRLISRKVQIFDLDLYKTVLSGWC